MNKQILFKKKCRTCLGQTKEMQSLEMLASLESSLSFADLLKEVVNINVKDDKNNQMPHHICIYCSRKLKSSYAFIKQALEANEELESLLNPTLYNGLKLDCLEETEVDVEKCLEIKIESGVDGGGETANIEMELPTVHPKTEIQEDYSVNEDVTGNIGNFESCNQLEKMEVSVTPINYTDSDTNDDKTDVKVQDLNDESDKFNNLDISVKGKMDYKNSDSDSDDDKCLSVLKADMLTKDDSTKNASKDDDLPVRCQTCNKIFNNSKELSVHLRNSHIPDDQKCGCPVCGATFTRNGSMYTHMRSFHKTEWLKSLAPTKEKLHECEKCHRKYTSKKNLNRHIISKHNKEEESDKQTLRVEDSIKKHEDRALCSICGASVCNKAELVIHLRRHTGEKPYKCELCNKSCLRKVDLKIHRRIHTGEKPYKCQICKKGFRVSDKLDNHMRSHTNERPYKCSQCERSFKYSKDLNIHHRIHTGERPYSCNVCGNTFTQSNSLRTHRLKLGHMEESI